MRRRMGARKFGRPFRCLCSKCTGNSFFIYVVYAAEREEKIVLILLAPLVYPLSLRLLISTPNALRTKGMMYVHKGKEGLFPISLRKLSSLHPFFCLAALLFPCVHTPPRENCSVFDPPSDRDKASGNSRQTLMASYRMIFIYRKM